jgi:hypothetical protein
VCDPYDPGMKAPVGLVVEQKIFFITLAMVFLLAALFAATAKPPFGSDIPLLSGDPWPGAVNPSLWSKIPDLAVNPVP